MRASATRSHRVASSRHNAAVRARGARGYSLLELLVAMSILTILTAAALPGHRSNRLQINTAHRLVMGTLRNARASAISKSVHFAVEFATTDTLLLQRMVQDSTGWQVDSTRVLTVPLPAPAYVMSSAVGTRVEFDSRGVAVNLLAPLQIDLSDPFGASKSLQAWPSGQINEL